MAEFVIRGYRPADEAALLAVWNAALPYDTVDAQTLRTHGSIGLALEASNRVQDSMLELPTLLGMAVPEMGAAWDDGSAPGFYVRWSIPVRIFLGEAAGLEVRSAVSVVDVPGDGTEAIATLQLGGFLR